MLTWEELAARTWPRQFPTAPLPPARLVGRVGPLQTQTARSAFLGLAARSPLADHEAVSAAYEQHALVRGSTLRGTVHTATSEQHRILDAVTRLGQRRLWERTLRLSRHALEEVWAGVEDYAADAWRTPAELGEALRAWLRGHGEEEAAARLETTQGRYFAFGHGGLVRRPLRGGWDAQGAPGYSDAATLLGLPLPDADEAVRGAVRLHLTAHGPASRHDIAWWSGLGLRVVDTALAGLDAAGALAWYDGPDARAYADLRNAPGPGDPPPVLLLPEFDAVLCGYDPPARGRFVDAAHHPSLWLPGNGLMLAPLLVDGRVTGWWRAPGSGRSRELEVGLFPGTRRPRKAELADAVGRAESALRLRVSGVTLSRV